MQAVKITIFGAGSIGCYVGGCLAAAGAHITLVARQRVISDIEKHGLTVTDYQGRNEHVPADHLELLTELPPEHDCDLVLVTVKSAATQDAATALNGCIAPHVPVISFQNGIHNADELTAHLNGNPVLAGMVPFNVIGPGQGKYHQGSAGKLEVQAAKLPEGTQAAFEKARLALTQHSDMKAVLWGKLLLNLNNPVNALSGIPLKEELSQRNYRRCVALAQREALAMMRLAGIQPAKVTPLPSRLLPVLMNVPDWLFTRAARKLLAIDPLARSSMWEDLEAGRTTEIDWINGEVVTLAKHLGRNAPVNAKLVELIRAAEQGGKRDWSGQALLAQLSKV